VIPTLTQRDRIAHDRTAPTYDRLVTRAFRPHHLIGLHPWVRSLAAKDFHSALDLGTGTAVVALRLSRVIDFVVALDHSFGMLEVARAKARRLRLNARTHFVRADCNRLPFPNHAFDVVTVQGVLHHTGSIDCDAVLNEIQRVLKPAGSLYISEPCTETNPLAHFLASIAGLLIRATRRLLRLPKPAPAHTSDHNLPLETPPLESPISSNDLISRLRNLGLAVRTRYLTNIPAATTLPDSLAASLIRTVSAPSGERFGDVVFIYATKP